MEMEMEMEIEMEIHPYVLQDIGPLGPLPKKTHFRLFLSVKKPSSKTHLDVKNVFEFHWLDLQ